MTPFPFFGRKLKLPSEQDEQDEGDELVKQIDKAKKEWNVARCQLDQMSEPDLIDYAVYRLQAAEKRYMYLLKTAEEKGVTRFVRSDRHSRQMKG